MRLVEITAGPTFLGYLDQPDVGKCILGRSEFGVCRQVQFVARDAGVAWITGNVEVGARTLQLLVCQSIPHEKSRPGMQAACSIH